MSFDKLLKVIKHKKYLRENGEHLMIPFCYGDRYKLYYDGFTKGDSIALLGSTGSGKSRLLRSWLYHMVDFAIATGYKLKISLFAMEDSEESIETQFLCHYLYTRHGISLHPRTLMSKETPLAEKYIQFIEKDADFWKKFYSIVDVYTEFSTPNQIRDKVRETYSNYRDYHNVVMLDNQSNITKDPEDATEFEAIRRFSRNIMRLGFSRAGITTITVMQLDFDQEKTSFRNSDKGSLSVLEPNLSSVGDAKVVTRNYLYVFALFIPHRFNIQSYPRSDDYNISILRSKAAFLLQLKSNEGEISPRFGLYADYLHQTFEPLPLAADKENLNKIYTKITEDEKQRVARLQGRMF